MAGKQKGAEVGLKAMSRTSWSLRDTNDSESYEVMQKKGRMFIRSDEAIDMFIDLQVDDAMKSDPSGMPCY